MPFEPNRRKAGQSKADQSEVAPLDPIALTLTRAPQIEAFRAADRLIRPWAYLDHQGRS